MIDRDGVILRDEEYMAMLGYVLRCYEGGVGWGGGGRERAEVRRSERRMAGAKRQQKQYTAYLLAKLTTLLLVASLIAGDH